MKKTDAPFLCFQNHHFPSSCVRALRQNFPNTCLSRAPFAGPKSDSQQSNGVSPAGPERAIKALSSRVPLLSSHTLHRCKTVVSMSMLSLSLLPKTWMNVFHARVSSHSHFCFPNLKLKNACLPLSSRKERGSRLCARPAKKTDDNPYVECVCP